MQLLDRYSLEILREFQRDSRVTMNELSERVGLSATPCWRRVKDLEQQGVIRRWTVLVDRQKVGLSACFLSHVTLSRHSTTAVEEFEAAVSSYPEVIECYSATGDADYVLKIVMADIAAYDAFLQSKLLKLSAIATVRTMVVLREIKYETALPV